MSSLLRSLLLQEVDVVPSCSKHGRFPLLGFLLESVDEPCGRRRRVDGESSGSDGTAVEEGVQKEKKGDKVRRQFGGGKRERRDENEQENSKNGDRVSKLSESVVDRISVLPLDDIVICRTLLLASVGFGGFVGGGGSFPFGGGRRRGC